MNRIGILGGTFDPPHIGHLILAEMALDALKLDQVLFVPAADPPHKDELRVSPIEHRLNMVRLAISDDPHFSLSRLDVDRPGPHYTVELLSLLRKQYPDADLYFLIGGDSLRDFVTWRDPAGIIRLAHLAVMRRPGAHIELDDLESALPGLTSRVVFVDAPVIGISATALRERVRQGATIHYQVPPLVETYIAETRLYG